MLGEWEGVAGGEGEHSRGRWEGGNNHLDPTGSSGNTSRLESSHWKIPDVVFLAAGIHLKWPQLWVGAGRPVKGTGACSPRPWGGGLQRASAEHHPASLLPAPPRRPGRPPEEPDCITRGQWRLVCGQHAQAAGLTCTGLLTCLDSRPCLSFWSVAGPEEVFLVLWEGGQMLGWPGLALPLQEAPVEREQKGGGSDRGTGEKEVMCHGVEGCR